MGCLFDGVKWIRVQAPLPLTFLVVAGRGRPTYLTSNMAGRLEFLQQYARARHGVQHVLPPRIDLAPVCYPGPTMRLLVTETTRRCDGERVGRPEPSW